MKTTDSVKLLLLAAIWGASFLFMRIAVPEMGAINTAFLRGLFGALGLALVMLLMRKPFSYQGKFRIILLLGMFNAGLPFLMYCLAAQILPAGYSAILNATTPIMGALIGASFFQQQLTANNVVGMGLGFAGILLITTTGDSAMSAHLASGVLACLIATACYGMAGYLAKRWTGGLDATQSAFASQVGATLFLLPFFAFNFSNTPGTSWTHVQAWMCILSLGFICTALAYILYFRLITDIGPLKSMTVTFLIPPFGILWGWLVLDETLNQGFAIGAALICVAVWLVVRPPRAAAIRKP
ncbi:DMT family transporter (plasmid) [Pantoea agglomerans]|uniref:DMT family transporter n=1 Tax=Enterobacter agglomerans TaxID=549 RepID=UPI0007E57059|nr:DMT family transporter [Pantoea agglomerans]WHU89945.1 DMT family transporter [Pantoea agglomerans pv. gypsophilae]WNN36658.1 DMT family transporter [Pantoea agglomerans]